jgi:hypothetical protein
MAGNGTPRFLHTGPSFALKLLLNLPYPNNENALRISERDFQIAMKAQTRDEATRTGVQVGVGRHKQGLHLQLLTEAKEGHLARHRLYLKEIRERKRPVLLPDLQWAKELANDLAPKIDEKMAAIVPRQLVFPVNDNYFSRCS